VLVRRASVAASVRRLVFAMRLSCGLRQLWCCHCRNPAIGLRPAGQEGRALGACRSHIRSNALFAPTVQSDVHKGLMCRRCAVEKAALLVCRISS
jgi:hypothetical protein